MTFVPGQNAPLQAPVVTFRAESQTPFDVSALVADANLRALTSADFVFYNQPSTAECNSTRVASGWNSIDFTPMRRPCCAS